MKADKTRQWSGIALLVAAAAVGLTACGGSKAPAVASLATTTSGSATNRTSAAAPTTSSGSPPSQARQQGDALKFSRCMRSNGVPNFPDPNPGGGFTFPVSAGFDPSSPAVRAAQAKCRKYMPAGPAGLAPGTQTHPSTQWLAHMVKVAQCMRRHGVPDFPDPRTSVPANPFAGGTGVISNIEGVILIFPSSIDMQSPTFTRAAKACSYPLHNH